MMFSFQLLNRACSRLLRGTVLPVAVLCFVFTNAAVSGTADVTDQRAARLAVFDDVWQTVRDRYYDAGLRGVDWDARRAAFRAEAANAVSSNELYVILRRLIGGLRDTHTRVFAPDANSDWRVPRAVGVGLSIREIEDELVVVSVEPDSAAATVGIRAGDVLTKINDVSVKEIFAAKIQEHLGASTVAAGRLRAAASLFEGAADSLVTVTWRNREWRERTAQLQRELREYPPTLRLRRIDDVLVIGFDAFAPETVREFFAVVTANRRGARGVVLDLRGNRGGMAEAMTDIASVFVPAGRGIGKFTDRSGKIAVAAETRSKPFFSHAVPDLVGVPVVLLTSTATSSAAEIFAAALQTEARARVVGTTTCGCVLAVRRRHPLPDGGVLEVSELDFQLANGKRLEGAGVAPDELVLPSRKDLLARRDRQLERALELLK